MVRLLTFLTIASFAAVNIGQAQEEAMNRLGNAYVEYIVLKRCSEAREGYLAVHISDAELARARQAVQRIEGKMRPQIIPGISTSWMWDKSNEYAKARPLSREACQFSYKRLMDYYSEMFPDDTIKKDF